MLQPDESSSRTLESLPPRPPTPPRDSQQNASRPSLFNRIFSKSLGAQTPPNLSPGSAAGAASSPSERANRRVAWSASTDYRDHEERPRNPNAINPKLRLIPSSADRQQPPKSILKQNNDDAVNRHIDFHIQPNAHTPETFATMLESVTKQLAGDDRLSRIDAYMSLSDVLKATDTIPDEEALRNKMGLLTQFIRRDMTALQADGEVDKVLVNNALTLLASLLWKNEQFPQDFAVFVLEHTITAFERAIVPKDVVKHLMFIIGQQNFSPKIVTTDRAIRLLHSTYLIQEKYNGKSIALGRLSVYTKLLQQAKAVMTMPTNTLWLRHVFEDMLNPVKNVRTPVISFGSEAALQLGTEKHGSRAFTELFESPYDEKNKFADYYQGRLLRMLQAKGENASLEKASVPRIWSIMIIFLRYKPTQLDKWEFWASYLHILQKCFNSSDQEVKAQANLAWNRLVFALQPDDNAEKRRLNRQLLQPFLGQLHAKRKPTGRPSKEAFQITVSSACNLLYYALRPSASHTSLDQLWDLYVPPLIQQLSETDSTEEEHKSGAASCEGSNQAIAILHALLNPTPRAKQPWRVDRAMSDERMRFDELSPIDPKWVRANSLRVLGVLQPLIRRRFKDLSADRSRLKDLWKGYLLSIAAAGSKEIITSNETMACIAQIYTMAHKLWQERPCHDIITQEGQPTAFLEGFVYLLTEMVRVLGMLPFGEKRLSVEDLDPFAVVATPSTGSRNTPKAAKTAVQCLLSLLVVPGPNIEANFAVKGALRRLLLPFYEFRAKHKTIVEFLQELFHTLPALDSAAEVNTGAVEAVWCVLAKFMHDTLDYSARYDQRSSGSSSNSSSNSQLLGVTFRDKVRVLEYGLAFLSHNAMDEWRDLYFQTSLSISDQVGVGGHALCLTEPLALAIHEQYKASEARSFLSLYIIIIEDAGYPTTEQSLEAARRKLWGVSTLTSRPSIDPYKHLYPTINFFLEKSYELEGSLMEVSTLVEHTGQFISRCPHVLHEMLLETLGGALALWLKDVDDVTNTADTHSKLKESIHSLWRGIESAIDTRPGHNSLSKLKTILAAALSSRHKHIVSSAIELWNERFGVLEELEYPDEVAKSLARLRPSANLLLPNFPDIASNEVPPAATNFIDSDDSDPMEYASTGGPRCRSLTPSIIGSSPFKARSSPGITLGLPRSTINHQHLEVPGTSSASKRKPAKLDTTPRLRHDNSQIKFAAIEHTPEPADAESQLLTDHQREIKERQQEENAAMFADLRSSPKPKAKKTEKKRLSLASDRPISQAGALEQPATPSVTSAMRTLDDWVTSSPTPQNRKQKHVPTEVDLTEVEEPAIEIPSSPPKARDPSPSPAAESRTPSPRSRSPVADVEMANTTPKLINVLALAPPPVTDVESPPSFANLVDHLAAESVTNSSPAVPSAGFKQLNKSASKRRRSPVKLSPRTTPEDEDEVMEETPPIALDTAHEAVPEAKDVTTPAPIKSKKRSRSKSSKHGRKSNEHQTETVALGASLAPIVQERRRSSSLSELDESMVKSLEQHHSVDDDQNVPYIALVANANFSPEEYEKVEVFSSPQKTPEPEPVRKETRILPPTKSAAKSKMAARKSGVKSTPEPTTVKTTRAAEKRKSMTPTVKTPGNTPQRASSRLRHVEPEVIDLEKVDPSLHRSGSKLSRSQRQTAFAESMKKTPASKAKNVDVVEETPAPAETTKKSHKKKVAEPIAEEAPAATETPKRSHKNKVIELEAVASPSVMETWLRKETPVPVPTRKRKSSQQVEREGEVAEPAQEVATGEANGKATRKRRKKEEKRLQAQVVEDSQQDQHMDVDHEGITVPPLSAVPEKSEKDNSSATFRTAKSASGSQTSSKVSVTADATQKKRKGKKGRYVKALTAIERSVVESSQKDEEERTALTKENLDHVMADVDPEPTSQQVSERGDTEDDAISVVSSHLEVTETKETTTVRYIDRKCQLQREVSKSRSPSKASPKSPSPAQTSPARDRDTDMAEAEVEAQLRSSIISNAAPVEPSTPPRATTTNQDVIPSSPPPAGQERIIQTSVEQVYISSSQPSDEVEHLSPDKTSNNPSSEKQQFSSSPPPQLTQEQIRVLEKRRRGSSQNERAAQQHNRQMDDDMEEEEQEEEETGTTRQQIRHIAPRILDMINAMEQAKNQATALQEQSKSSTSSFSLNEEQQEDLTYENIAAVFAHGIEMLNRVDNGIRRHHVAKMEEMVFDIKAAIYNAEKRCRENMSEEEKREEFRRRWGESPPVGEL